VNVLLDTCTFLWLTTDAVQLTPKVKEIFKNKHNKVYLSVVSTWEMTVKYKLGKLPLPVPPFEFVRTQRDLYSIENLNLMESSLHYLLHLPDHHRDPFDRMLICQALDMNLVILTPDPFIQLYPITTLW